MTRTSTMNRTCLTSVQNFITNPFLTHCGDKKLRQRERKKEPYILLKLGILL